MITKATESKQLHGKRIDGKFRFVPALLVLGLLACALPLWPAPAAGIASPAAPPGRHVSGEILVGFRQGTTLAEIGQLNAAYRTTIVGAIPQIRVARVRIPAGADEGQVAAAYQRNPHVQYAELNYMATAVGIPSDPYLTREWGLLKVQTPQAWDVTTGSSTIIIAVLDTGIDSTHPDLSGKVSLSVNFSPSSTTSDLYGHGTHVAGIAAAAANNGVGIAGVGYNSTLMNVKVLGDDGTGSYSSLASGVVWATDRGAKVINMSLGGTSPSSTVEDAVNYAWSKGVVVIAAAGNNGSTSPFYPAYYTNTIAVAATDSNDQLVSFSNRGDWVDVGAPGVSIYSTVPTGSCPLCDSSGYRYASGTSMAAPHTAGLAGLVFTQVKDADGDGLLSDEVRACIQNNADNIGISSIGSGRINAYWAVQCPLGVPSPTPTATPTLTPPLPSPTISPSTGSVTGTVTDASSGAPIAGATVTAGSASTSTDASGAYTVTGLAQGSHTVTAAATGYSSTSDTVSVVAGQATREDLPLVRAPNKPIWVQGITFRVAGRNLQVGANVVSDSGAAAGASLRMQVTLTGGQSWTFSGTTDSYGKVSFTVRKAPKGTYAATVTSLTAAGYTWDTTKGVASATYTLK